MIWSMIEVERVTRLNAACELAVVFAPMCQQTLPETLNLKSFKQEHTQAINKTT